jgi:HSP20 family molecular chaperone IbpA
LPKSFAGVASASPQANPNTGPAMNDLAAFDQRVIDRMARMQGRMEQMFRDAFPNDLTSGFNSLRLGSAVNVQDQNDRYIARFYLPDNDLKNVNVQLENDQLRLTASETERHDEKGATRMQSGSYEQVVTLPGPVKQKGTKVERKNGTIVVTVPKAGSVS